MESLRIAALGVVFALFACEPYHVYEYAPVTSQTTRALAPTCAPPSNHGDETSGELPTTADPYGGYGGALPYYPVPRVHVGGGYDPQDSYPPRPYVAPAYGPGGGGGAGLYLFRGPR